MTKDEYDDHISTRKTVEKLINSKLHAESVSRSFELAGENGCRYRLFLRRNQVLFESFSVGIDWISPEANIPLCRYNGKHGPTARDEHPSRFHRHQPSWKGGERAGKALSNAILDDRFATIEEALTTACEECRINGMEEHFPHLGQGELHFE